MQACFKKSGPVRGNAAYAGLLPDAGKAAEPRAENEGGGGAFPAV